MVINVTNHGLTITDLLDAGFSIVKKPGPLNMLHR